MKKSHTYKNFFVNCLYEEQIPDFLSTATPCSSLTRAQEKRRRTFARETRKFGFAVRVYYKPDGSISHYKIFD